MSCRGRGPGPDGAESPTGPSAAKGPSLYPSPRWQQLLHPRHRWLKGLQSNSLHLPRINPQEPYHDGLASFPWDLRAREEYHQKPERRDGGPFAFSLITQVQAWNFRSYILWKPHRNKIWGGLCSLGSTGEGQAGRERLNSPGGIGEPVVPFWRGVWWSDKVSKLTPGSLGSQLLCATY